MSLFLLKQTPLILLFMLIIPSILMQCETIYDVVFIYPNFSILVKTSNLEKRSLLIYKHYSLKNSFHSWSKKVILKPFSGYKL